jgi:hypothetical protein
VAEIDPIAADAVIGIWLLERAGRDDRSTPAGELALDGKTLPGAKDSDGNQIHLLAAMTHAGLVAGQVEVGAKTPSQVETFRKASCPYSASLGMALVSAFDRNGGTTASPRAPRSWAAASWAITSLAT